MTGPKIALLRMKLDGQPGATLYAAALPPLAERLAADAAEAGTGDSVEVLDAAAFAVSAHVTETEVQAGLLLLGVQRPDGIWWEPPATTRRRTRN